MVIPNVPMVASLVKAVANCPNVMKCYVETEPLSLGPTDKAGRQGHEGPTHTKAASSKRVGRGAAQRMDVILHTPSELCPKNDEDALCFALIRAV